MTKEERLQLYCIIRILVDAQEGCLGMGNGGVVFHELGSCLSTDGSNCWAFGIIGLVIILGVDTLDNIMYTLFANAGT